MSEQPGEEGTVRYVRCPSCGTPNPEVPNGLCTRCGKPLHEPKFSPPRPPVPKATGPVVCSNCRKELPPGSKFCGFCGSALPATPPPPPPPTVRPQQGRTTPPPKVATTPVPSRKATPPTPEQNAPTSAIVPPGRVQTTPRVSTPPRTTPPAVPKPAEGGGTQVFLGLHVPKIEAKIIEVKQDGSTGKSLRILKETFIGRGNCDASYPEDVLLAPRHASLRIREGKLFLNDLGTPNGTFVKLRQDTELSAGDIFLLGREIFRFTTQRMDDNPASLDGTLKMSGAPSLQPGPITAKLEHIQLSGELIKEYSLDKPETTIGRTTGDLTFKDDPYMSGAHARVVVQPGRFVLQDLKSRNGVYRRIRDEIELKDTEEFFLGEQLFRVEIQTEG
jgi:pSer/pThr/pTyr-binding forkhead associated (FHA) protein